MTAWIDTGGLLLLAGGLIAAASAVSGGRWLRVGLALAATVVIVDALLRPAGIAAPALAAIVLVANGLSVLRMAGGSRLDGDDAQAFYQRHLSRLTPAQASLLIAQGNFIEGRAGEILTREGEPVESLHFLVDGVAAVLVDDAIVGRLGPGDLIGEAALLGEGRASATVRLAAERNRLWFIAKDRLAAFLAVQPAIAAELNAATVSALRDKLERVNKERAVG